MTPEHLSSLLERVSGATGPDRELDVLLHAELVEERDVRYNANNLLLGRSRRAPHDECVLGSIDPGRAQRNFQTGFSSPAWPAYTASLDAALALVERVLPGKDVDICIRQREPYAKMYRPEHGHWAISTAVTPALAVCSALLQALISLHPQALESSGDMKQADG